jgi:acyl carrier protein
MKAGRDAPRDETESRICTIWQDALGIDEIGVHDSFADLGGHSLIAIRIVAQLRQAFDLELPMRALFDAPTIAELSARIKREMVAEIEALTDEQAARLVSNA